MAHIKAGGKTKNGRNSPGQRLGVKLYAGQPANAGQILIRQNGTRWHAGENVRIAKDYTLYAGVTGEVAFNKKQMRDFSGKLRQRTFITIVPN